MIRLLRRFLKALALGVTGTSLLWGQAPSAGPSAATAPTATTAAAATATAPASATAAATVATTTNTATATAPRALRATRDIMRDEVLTSADMDGDGAAADSLVGWVARRRIATGETLRAPAIGRRPLVSAGATVTLVSTTGGVSVTRSGTALSGGALGQRVRVRLEGTRIVVATVTGAAEATLP